MGAGHEVASYIPPNMGIEPQGLVLLADDPMLRQGGAELSTVIATPALVVV